jgi:hypothetical protein
MVAHEVLLSVRLGLLLWWPGSWRATFWYARCSDGHRVFDVYDTPTSFAQKAFFGNSIRCSTRLANNPNSADARSAKTLARPHAARRRPRTAEASRRLDLGRRRAGRQTRRNGLVEAKPARSRMAKKLNLQESRVVVSCLYSLTACRPVEL